MAKLLYLYYFTVVILSVWGQENAVRNLSPSLHECYDNKFLLQRNNRLPHTLNTLISILRKIENTEGLNMDLRSLSVALIHRFRQDGIIANPDVPAQDGVTPYAPNDFQFYRHAQTLRYIPGNALHFPNNSITNIERCTLHFMLSSSIETLERGDEGKVCRYTNLFRHARNIRNVDESTSKDTNNDVETFTPDELKTMTDKKHGGAKVPVDPNSFYSALPPNHPNNTKKTGSLTSKPRSKCPVENGVIKTPWGVVSPGLVISAIAAATQPETVKLLDVQPDLLQTYNVNSSEVTLDNKWLATLAGDLAEVALIRGPVGKKISVGGTGHWKSTALPRWYFLDSNDTLEMTTAEIRGDLDGLILANEINKWYSKMPSLKLSQVFDMYYSVQGFFDSSTRACNRRTLFTSVAPNETMSAQAYSAAVLLNPDISSATLDLTIIKQFSIEAVNDLTRYIPSSMNDLSCNDTDISNDLLKAHVDLTIILDTCWPFSAIQPILATLLENIDLNQFNSNFTLINGHDGTEIINSTFSILDFYAYNSSHYENITHGFDLSKSIDKLQNRSMNKLDDERNRGIGGAKSDVVLIIPYVSSISISDKDYCLQNILKMREQIPDTTFLIMAYASKDTWSDFVQNPRTDLFTIGIGDTEVTLAPIIDLAVRIKQVPKRLINTQCGSNYNSSGPSNSYTDYVAPNEINLYKLHPNYFFKHEGSATIKIQGSNLDRITVCTAREPLHSKTENVSSKTCVPVTADVYDIKISCTDATFIHQCPPLYISVSAANSTSIFSQCTDRECRYPNSIKYKISYEDLVCVSSASKFAFSSLILIVLLIFFNL